VIESASFACAPVLSAAAAASPESPSGASPTQTFAASSGAAAADSLSAATRSHLTSVCSSLDCSLSPPESAHSQIFILFVFVFGFVFGLFLVGPGITGRFLVSFFQSRIFVRITISSDVRQYGPFELNLPLPLLLSSMPLFNLSLIRAILSNELSRQESFFSTNISVNLSSFIASGFTRLIL
jgi:hypothetical protein